MSLTNAMTAGARRPRGVGVERQDEEGDEERQVLGDPVAAAADARDLEHGLDADELQRDVGHRREEAGDRHGEGEPARAEPAADEVGGSHVAVPVRRPTTGGHEDEDDRVEHDRVGHGEEAADSAGRPHRGGNGDERVGRVEVAAEQEPRDPRAERPAAEAPLLEALHARRAAPARGPEAGRCDDDEEEDEHGQGDAVDAAGVGGRGDREGAGGHRVPSSRWWPADVSSSR